MLGSHHSIALIGPYGAGKAFTAMELAKMLLGADYQEHKVFRISKKEPIGIEDIRSLQLFLSLKTTGDSPVRRVVIIQDAQTMTIEAQNALLKTLEEPPADTKIILTITDTTSLRQTVYSRLLAIHVHPSSEEQIVAYFKKSGYSHEALRKAYLISRGYVGLCSALASNSEHDLIKAIAEAKLFLNSTTYERLISVEGLAKDKEKLALLLYAAKRVLAVAMHTTSDNRVISSIISKLKTIYTTERSLHANPNMKLILTDLALTL